jgi:23S rRNA (guanosine2251-2'-O)-methyltransferase
MKTPQKPSKPFSRQTDPGIWLWGIHPVKAALENPKRQCHHLWCTPELFDKACDWATPRPQRLAIQKVDKQALDQKFPQAVHQGVALCVASLPSLNLSEFCQNACDTSVVLVLDHVTDPHNVGALLRVGAALGVDAMLVTEKHAPPFQGALAKSASGALEQVPLVVVSNLAQALDCLKKNGFWCIGLAEEGSVPLPEVSLGEKLALVLGAEGEGLRRLTRERCDILAFLPTSPTFSTLNVSTAGAIALYELQSRKKRI